MRGSPLLMLAASILCLDHGAAQAASARKAEAAPKALTRAEIAKLPIAPEARAEIAVKTNPKDPQVRLDAARAYLHAAQDTPQNVAAAERHLAEALKLTPNNFDALVMAGDAAIRRNEALTAASHYQKAARINPDHASVQLRLGGALQRLGDTKGADAAYDAYRRLSRLPPLERQDSAKPK